MVVASSLMMGMAFGLMISVSVFLQPLEAAFGWERGVTSFAYSSGSFVTGLMGIGIGRLVDRFPPRPIVLVGALVMGAAHLLLSRLDSVGELYLIYGLMVGGLGNGCFMIPLVTNISFWFERNRGLAMATVMAGQSLGGALVPALARWLVSTLEWREAYFTLGLVAWAVLVPLALLVRQPPGLAAARAAEHVPTPGRTPLAPLPLTMSLSVAIVACCICMSIPIIHAFPLAMETGFSAAQASLVLGVMMASSILGRIGIGKVADYAGGVRALLLSSGLQTALIFWFPQTRSLPVLLLVAALFGIGYGGVVPSYAIIIREMIPARMTGVVMGTVFFFGNLGMSTGGYLGGALHDLSGAYPVSFAAGALSGVVNLLIVGTLLFHTRVRRAALPQPA
jgi:MFS family permease